MSDAKGSRAHEHALYVFHGQHCSLFLFFLSLPPISFSVCLPPYPAHLAGEPVRDVALAGDAVLAELAVEPPQLRQLADEAANRRRDAHARADGIAVKVGVVEDVAPRDALKGQDDVSQQRRLGDVKAIWREEGEADENKGARTASNHTQRRRQAKGDEQFGVVLSLAPTARQRAACVGSSSAAASGVCAPLSAVAMAPLDATTLSPARCRRKDWADGACAGDRRQRARERRGSAQKTTRVSAAARTGIGIAGASLLATGSKRAERCFSRAMMAQARCSSGWRRRAARKDGG